jgi:two-component system cell cycle sensor histidine kinase/response regulator CckA
MGDHDHESGEGGLRRRAEELIDRMRQGQSGRGLPGGPELLEELLVHQAELGLQNRDRREALNALEMSRQRYVALFDLAPVGYVILDTDSVVLEANRMACKMLCISAKDLIGKPMLALVDAAHYESFVRYQRRVFRDQAPGSAGIQSGCELLMARREGGAFYAHVESMVIGEPGSEELRCLTTIADVTSQKEAAEQRRELEVRVQQAQKLQSLRVLAGGIAHDFNNLLVGMLGHADLALLDLPLAAPARSSIGEIRKAALRAAELSNQMLAYSGQGSFVVGPVVLNELLAEVEQLLRSQLSEQVALRLDLAADLPPIDGDVSQLKQVLFNLLTNAAEAIGDDAGLVTLTTSVERISHDFFDRRHTPEALPEGDYVQLMVEDTGCGMDEATLAKIFEPFFSTKFTGRGLGLAAVLGIVRGHHGALRADSEVGKSTRVRLVFPISLAQAERRDQRDLKQASATRGKQVVLLVDDDETIRDVGERMLIRLGYGFELAATGHEAIELLRQRSGDFSAMILDMALPGIDGAATLKAARKLDAQLPVVLTSGHDPEHFAELLGGTLAQGYLQKPFNVQQLAEAVETVLELLEDS